MASLGQTFNTAELPESEGFDSLPAGDYQVTIDRAEVKTPDASKQGLSVGYKVNGPTHAGRLVFDYINLKNPSSECERIGRQTLGGLLRAIGLGNVSDSDQIIGKNLVIKLTKEKDNSQYANDDGFVNRVKSYKASSGVAPTNPGAAPADNAPSSRPPWG